MIETRKLAQQLLIFMSIPTLALTNLNVHQIEQAVLTILVKTLHCLTNMRI
jgi:hypothetical protein